MSHRREQKEALRREREERERQARAAEQRKKLVGYGAGGLLALAAIAVLVCARHRRRRRRRDAQAAEVFPDGGSVPEQKVFDVGAGGQGRRLRAEDVKGAHLAEHTTSLDERVKYNTNPPTSGRHYQIPAEDGIYGDPPQDEELVHGMEHGRVIFWVKPSLPEDSAPTSAPSSRTTRTRCSSCRGRTCRTRSPPRPGTPTPAPTGPAS